MAAGVTEGTLSWTKKEIKRLVKGFTNRDLAFIQDSQTIDIVKETRKSTEWDLYKRYLKDKRLRILAQMGITLRKLEKDQDALHKLREKIQKAYGTEGLHIAEFVQSGILLRYLGIVGDRFGSIVDITSTMEEMLNTVDKYTFFIKETDDPKKKAKEVLIRTQANLPSALILCSSGSAIKKADKIITRIEADIEDIGYDIDQLKERGKVITFIIKKP